MADDENIILPQAADLDNSITLMSLAELLDKKFFIPSYQRGYRWTDQQVKELLNDTDELANSRPKEGQFYCLQPLVVKKMNETERIKFGLEGSPWYEVVDGQQRLTTLHLLLTHLHQTQIIDKLELLITEYNSTKE